MTENEIRAALQTVAIGQRIALHERVGSTNDLAREAGRRGEPEGLVVLAEEQTKGRGRLGRTWVAPPGCCVLGSVLLKPRFSAEHAFHLTMAAALSIARACEWAAGGHPLASIKWPNDVLLNGRKVAGILSESEFAGSEWSFSVVGFGINVNLSPAVLGEVRSPATSLSAELGRLVDRVALLAKVLAEFEGMYMAMQSGQFASVFDGWSRSLDTLGRRVTVEGGSGGKAVSGQAIGVESDGALVVRLEGGAEHRVVAGDVS